MARFVRYQAYYIMADGRPIKQVKFQKPQKAQLHPLRDVCQKLKKSMHVLPSSAPETKCGRGTDGHPRRRHPPPPHFVGRGIKRTQHSDYVH